MRPIHLPTTLKALLAALCLPFALQNCTKELEDVSPQSNGELALEASADCGAAPTPCKTVCLVAGQNKQVGTVDVAMTNRYLYVTYNITKPNVYLREAHLDVFKDLTQFRNARKLTNGGAVPGKFAYGNAWSSSARKTSYSVAIPMSAVNAASLANGCLNIAAHAALSNGESAWGGLCNATNTGVSLCSANQFPGSNWSAYFDFCKDACAGPVDFTYAWEDLRTVDGWNDGDYNDLVVKSAVTRNSNSMEIKFQVAARGAGADHKFKFRIAKTGVTGVFGADSYTTVGDSIVVTVFPSTKTALPPASATSEFANTVPTEPCQPAVSRTVTIATNGSFVYNAAKPYEPFISVYLSRTAGVGPSYDLYIYQVSRRDTWTALSNGQLYPNGILIPSDWEWPTEQNVVTNAYPNFTGIVNGSFTPNFTNLQPDQTFETCD